MQSIEKLTRYNMISLLTNVHRDIILVQFVTNKHGSIIQITIT